MNLLVLSMLVFAGGSTVLAPAADQRVVCGPLVLEVHVSRTAHVFHLVDQISAWDNACHGQYRRHMELSEEDERLLAGYAAVRAKRRWGQGLEQTFYTPLELEAAIRAGLRAGHLRPDEAEAIRPVLEHFAGRAEELLASKKAVLDGAFDKLDRARLERFAKQLARFTGVRKLSVPTFPLASPEPGGGGMDGGVLRWELCTDELPFSVLAHELTHAFVMQKQELIEAVAADTPGLSTTLLGEGLAYALAPGLERDGEQDLLRLNVAQDRADGKSWEDEGYGRQRLFGLALRPLLSEALEREKLEDFLPRARDVFRALREVHEARADAPGLGPPKLAVAGPSGAVVRERLLDSRFHLWISCFDHVRSYYDEVLPKLGKGDLLVLLVAADDGGRIPAEHAALAPLAPDEVERRLGRGESVAEERTREDGLRIVLLAAPRRTALEELARTTPLLAE